MTDKQIRPPKLLGDGVKFKSGQIIWSPGYLVYEVFDRSFRSRGRSTHEVMLSANHSVVLPTVYNTRKLKPTLTFEEDAQKWYLNRVDLRYYLSTKKAAFDKLKRELDWDVMQAEAAKQNLDNLFLDRKAERVIPLQLPTIIRANVQESPHHSETPPVNGSPEGI